MCIENSGFIFFNYEDPFSLVLMVIINAKYGFLLNGVATNGRILDKKVNYVKFYEIIKNYFIKYFPTVKTT